LRTEHLDALPSAKALALERELYVSELLAAIAGRVGELSERLDALDERVAKLEAKRPRQ
jgi:hypothetical protein